MPRKKRNWWGGRMRQDLVRAYTQFQALEESFEQKGDAEKAAICGEAATHVLQAMRGFDRLDWRPPRARGVFEVMGIEPPRAEPLDLAKSDEPESG